MKKILAVSSSGGHWTQLMMIIDAFEGHDLSLMTTYNNPAVARRPHGSRLIKVRQARITQKLLMAILASQVLFHIVRLRPDIVVSTGAAPGYFAVLFGKLLGAKTIWLDSIANYERPSLSGQKIQPYCDKFLTQWPHLSPPATYWGKVL